MAAAALACSNDLEKQSRVSKLRVLAVRADPAELVLDGGTPEAVFTPLAVNPDGGAIGLTWAVCAFTGDAPPGDLPCPGGAGLALPDAGGLSARLSLADPRLGSFVAQLDGGLPDAAVLEQGLPLLVGFSAQSGPETLNGFFTLTLRDQTRGPPRQNPVLTGVRVIEEPADGGEPPGSGELLPQDVRAGVKYRLTPEFVAGDAGLGFSFFATGGEISSLRSAQTNASGGPAPVWTDFTAPGAPGDVTVWVVARDPGGASAWVQSALHVR